MKFTTFPQGDQMPLLGLGTWKSNDREAYNAVREAIRIGYRHFDCASRYENEKEIGEALSDAISDGEVTREELWITSKLWNNAHQKKHVRPNLLQTLNDLRLEYVDLYLIHWPVILKPEIIFPDKAEDFIPLEEVPIEETWLELEKCTNDGLVKYLGVSNFSIKKIKDLLTHCQIRPTCNQVESHPFFQQKDLLSFCKSEGIVLTAYSPLGSQDRPDRLKKVDDPFVLTHPTVLDIAKSYGVSAAQILIAWAVCRGTSVIPKSSNPDRLRENFVAADLELDKPTMDEITRLDRGFRYIDGTIWTIPGSPYTLENLWDE